MSERGSWITRFIYCHACGNALFTQLQAKSMQCGEKWLSVRLIAWAGHPAIIGGGVGDTWAGGETMTWEELAEELLVCHPILVVVVQDDGRVTTVTIPPQPAEPTP